MWHGIISKVREKKFYARHSYVLRIYYIWATKILPKLPKRKSKKSRIYEFFFPVGRNLSFIIGGWITTIYRLIDICDMEVYPLQYRWKSPVFFSQAVKIYFFIYIDNFIFFPKVILGTLYSSILRHVLLVVEWS